MAITNKGQFEIDGVVFNAKSIKVKYEGQLSPDSGRADNGRMYVGWTYPCLRKVEIEMPPCSSEEVSLLLGRIQGKEYNLTYYDAMSNRNYTALFYTAGSKTDLYSGVILNGLYQGVSFTAIAIDGV